jgi:hypothetical protein
MAVVNKSSTAARKSRPAAVRKPAAKAAAKPAARSAAKAAAQPVAIPAAKPARTDKPKKPKLVRDSFTIPKTEYAVLDTLKDRAARLGRPAKKSELLRAGIKLLAGQLDAAFSAALAAVPAIKTGRPARD